MAKAFSKTPLAFKYPSNPSPTNGRKALLWDPKGGIGSSGQKQKEGKMGNSLADYRVPGWD